MQNLLQWILHSRLRTTFAAVSAVAVPLPLLWLALALIGLVSMRMGLAEALMLTVWSGLPALVKYSKEISPFATIALPWMLLSSLLLRRSDSWNVALMANLCCAALTVVALQTVGVEYLDLFYEQAQTVWAQLIEQAGSSQQSRTTFAISRGHMAVMLAGLIAILVLACLLLSRYWHSMLYEPGRFGREFKALRLRPMPAAVLAGLAVAAVLSAQSEWLLIICLSPLLTGMAFVHWLANRYRCSQWLFLLYLLLLIQPQGPLPMLLISLAAADSVVDLRARIGHSPTPPDGDHPK